MALVDADYHFIWVDIGSPGSHSDSQVFNHSELKEAIDDNSIGFPQPACLPGDDKDIPFFLVGDDIFALRSWLMKPYGRRKLSNDERIFNYRLSRCRRIVENAFGILANRFQCLLKVMMQHPDTVAMIVEACICLHNLMRTWNPGMPVEVDREDENYNVIPGSWRIGRSMDDVTHPPGGGSRASKVAKSQRAYLKHYYNSPQGKVPWQDRMV